MEERDIIVIGASAGGVETLIQLCKKLPDHLPAALFVAIHLANNTPSLLPHILERSGKLPAVHPKDGAPIRPGIIYVAPADYHLEIYPGEIHLSHGPKENGYRPAIDRMFRTAAQAYGPRVVGVVLSGMLSDGSLGLQAIHEAGGLALVQDPQEALFPSMPEHALRSVPADGVLPLAGIAAQIVRAAGTPTVPALLDPAPGPDEIEQQAETDREAFRGGETTSPRSLLTCPSCGGVLWELEEGGQKVYLCQTGHRFSLESMFEHQSEGVEAALWAAVRALEERASLTYRLAEMSAGQGRPFSQKSFLASARQAERDAQAIRHILERAKQALPEEDPPAGRKQDQVSNKNLKNHL